MDDFSLTDRLAGRDLPESERPGFADHPAFTGVRLARLIDTTASGGRFATLMVELEPGARMLAHRHATQFEQHLVLAGDGVLATETGRRTYRPGILAVIPEGAEHSVTAGPHGMVMLALFSPAQA